VSPGPGDDGAAIWPASDKPAKPDSPESRFCGIPG